MIIIFKLEGRRPHLHFIAIGVVLIGLSFLILNLMVMNYALLADSLHPKPEIFVKKNATFKSTDSTIDQNKKFAQIN